MMGHFGREKVAFYIRCSLLRSSPSRRAGRCFLAPFVFPPSWWLICIPTAVPLQSCLRSYLMLRFMRSFQQSPPFFCLCTRKRLVFRVEAEDFRNCVTKLAIDPSIQRRLPTKEERCTRYPISPTTIIRIAVDCDRTYHECCGVVD